MENLVLVLPEIFISLSIMFLLILGVFKKNSSKFIQNISLLVLLITAVIIFNETLGIEEIILFNGSVIIDYLSSFMKIVTLLATFLTLVISSNYLRSFKIWLAIFADFTFKYINSIFPSLFTTKVCLIIP